jgi:hypothetical protein
MDTKALEHALFPLQDEGKCADWYTPTPDNWGGNFPDEKAWVYITTKNYGAYGFGVTIGAWGTGSSSLCVQFSFKTESEMESLYEREYRWLRSLPFISGTIFLGRYGEPFLGHDNSNGIPYPNKTWTPTEEIENWKL